MLINPGEVITGALVNAIAVVGRQVGKTASGLRKPDDELTTARWFETFRLTGTLPELPHLSAASGERLAGILAGAEIQAALQELLAARLTDAPESDASRARDAVRVALSTAGPDTAKFAEALAGYYDDQICGLVARLEAEEPPLLAQIRSEAFSSRMISILRAIEQHTAALADNERGSADGRTAGRQADMRSPGPPAGLLAEVTDPFDLEIQTELPPPDPDAGIVIGPPIMGRDIRVTLPLAVTPAMSGLPPASPAFAGRDEPLAELLEALDPEGDRPTALVSAVGGMGGVGKTELALQAAHLAMSQGWFPGGVLFVDLFGYDEDRRRDPAQALAGLLTALGVPDQYIPVLGEDRSRMFRSILAEFAKADCRILLVVDNATPGQPVDLLLPSDGRTAAIVISRHTLAMLDARLVDLNVLGRADAVAMLGQTVAIARPGDTMVADAPGDAAELVEMCGRLPLAVRIVAALLAEQPQVRLAALVAELRALPLLEELRFDQYGVDTAFRLSYRALTPEQQRVFRMLTINPGPDFTVVTICWLCDLPLPQAVILLKDLARAHLVEPTGVPERWRMHDLIRLYASDLEDRHSTEDDRDAALSRLLEGEANLATGVLAHFTPGTPDQAAYGPAFGVRDKQQADYWLATEVETMTAAAHLALSRDGEVAIDLPLCTAALLMHRKSYSQARALATQVRVLAREVGEVNLEARALLILALSEGLSWGRLDDAVAAYEEAKAIFRASGSRLFEAQAALEMGGMYVRRGHSTEAAAMQREAAEIFGELGDRRWEAEALFAAGEALKGVDEQEAISTFLAAGEIFEEVGAAADKAAMLIHVGDLLPGAEAIARHTEALEILRAAGERKDEAYVLVRLGDLLAEADRVAESIEVAAEAVAVCRDAVDVAETANDAYQAREAQQLLAYLLRNQARLLARLNRYEEAVAVCRDAVDVAETANDAYQAREAQQLLAYLLRNQARLLARLNRYEEAVAVCRDAVDVAETAHDAYQANGSLRLLAALQCFAGRIDEALSALTRAVTAVSDDILHSSLLPQTLNERGQIELAADRGEAALESFTRSQAASLSNSDRADAAATSLLAAYALLALERDGEATTQAEAGLNAYRDLGDELGMAQARLLQGLILLMGGGDDQAGLDLLDQAAPALLSSPDHSTTQARATAGWLAAMRALALHGLGRQDESLIAYHTASAAFEDLDVPPFMLEQFSGALRYLEHAYATPAPRRIRRLFHKVQRSGEV